MNVTVYHGTTRTFDRLRDPRRGAATSIGAHSMGLYFSSERSEAERYGGRILKVELNLSKPLDLRKFGDGTKNVKAFLEGLPIKINDSIKHSIIYNNEWLEPYKVLETLDVEIQLVPKLKQHGYDSIIFCEGSGHTYVVIQKGRIAGSEKISEMKLMTIYNQYTRRKLYELAAYRGGDPVKHTNPRQANLVYFTPNVEYAKWFESQWSGKNVVNITINDLDSIETDNYRFLDLRSLTGDVDQLTFYKFLSKYITLPQDIQQVLAIPDRLDDFKYPVYLLIKNTELWDEISKRYDGVIIREYNKRNAEVGEVDAYVILKKRLRFLKK